MAFSRRMRRAFNSAQSGAQSALHSVEAHVQTAQRAVNHEVAHITTGVQSVIESAEREASSLVHHTPLLSIPQKVVNERGPRTSVLRPQTTGSQPNLLTQGEKVASSILASATGAVINDAHIARVAITHAESEAAHILNNLGANVKDIGNQVISTAKTDVGRVETAGYGIITKVEDKISNLTHTVKEDGAIALGRVETVLEHTPAEIEHTIANAGRSIFHGIETVNPLPEIRKDLKLFAVGAFSLLVLFWPQAKPAIYGAVNTAARSAVAAAPFLL